MNCFLLPCAGDVRICGLLYWLALFKHLQVFFEQRPIEGIGMIEVDVLSLFDRNIGRVFVVVVLWNDDYFSFGSRSMSLLTTVVLPEPVPPAMPMINIR